MTVFTTPATPPLPPAILSDQPALGGGNGQPHRERRFKYDGQEFDDPGSQYSIREVMGFLAETYPELASGSWTKTPLADYDVVTFYKVTGEKGLHV